MLRSYSELIRIPTFEERYNYLRLHGQIGEDTFGFERYLNQEFYHSDAWKTFRHKIIIRDNGNDLGVDGFQIGGRIIIHHIQPITIADIRDGSPIVLDPENVICVSHTTHEAIHFGSEDLLASYFPNERRPGDTKLW
jgi:hypothetical protein